MKDPISRGNCFKLLAVCFYEPEQDLFIEEQICQNLAALLKEVAPDAADAANKMSLALESNAQEQLNIDHASLFIGPFKLLAAPYGSVFYEKNRQLMGETTTRVHQFYNDAGLIIDQKEPPDHIAIELEFMHYLSLKEAEATSTGEQTTALTFRRMQVDFFQYALSWIPDFCNAIRNGTGNSFYLALADCLEQFTNTASQFYKNTRQPA